MLGATRSCLSVLILAALACPAASTAQNTISAPVANSSTPQIQSPLPHIDTDPCQQITAGGHGPNLLPALCEFAVTFRHNLPDFICEQTTAITGLHSSITLKAEVTFEKGRERYSTISVASDPPAAPSAIARQVRFLSAGELGSDLVGLFTPPIGAEFQFEKEVNLHKVSALLYGFHVAAEKNTFWSLGDNRDLSLHPELKGALWLRREDGRILRLEIKPVDLPRNVPANEVEVSIDYSDTPIRDLSSFLLPAKSETKVCIRGVRTSCTTSVLTFRDCRKFAAKTRIITDGQN